MRLNLSKPLRSLALLALGLMLPACDAPVQPEGLDNIALEAPRGGTHSSTAGNLMAEAIRRVHDLDIVLYPRPLIDHRRSEMLKRKMSAEDIESVLQLFPAEGDDDQFIVGSIRGKDLKRLVFQRSQLNYDLEIEVAGLWYHIHFIGGFPQLETFSKERNVPLEDDAYYRVAVSQTFFFSGRTFPGYLWGNSFNFIFDELVERISARAALEKFLTEGYPWPFWQERRGNVTTTVKAGLGFKRIFEIQGPTHRSPFWGHQVETQGIVTAVANSQWFPGGMDIYIQDLEGDGDDHTSDAIHLHFREENLDIEIGDNLWVRGTVIEQLTLFGLGQTSIRDIEEYKIMVEEVAVPEVADSAKRRAKSEIELQNFLPKPVLLGEGGRPIPDGRISRWRGNLNIKPFLSLSEGIDFWESLEGMRVEVKDLRIVGFRGGASDFERDRAQTYLTLHTIPDGTNQKSRQSHRGGVLVDELQWLYNPQILHINSNHLTYIPDTDVILTVGDLMRGRFTGVLGYMRNLFGEGEYTLLMPQLQKSLTEFLGSKRIEMQKRGGGGLALDDELVRQAELLTAQRSPGGNPTRFRPRTRLIESHPLSGQALKKDHQLSVAAFNIENLAGNQTHRVKEFARAIEITLLCPDIVVLVEIQDFNGQDFRGSSSGEETIRELIRFIRCAGADYKAVNIDPVVHSEGGQPGGNIRTAMIYDATRVGFTERNPGQSLNNSFVDRSGNLSANPGRIMALDKAFLRTRRSLVAQFDFRGEKIFVVGNHFNSKLGDVSMWGAQQPPVLRSDMRRTLLADRINDFVRLAEIRAPDAHVIVAGDFNVLQNEASMKVLMGEQLVNLMNYGNLVPPENRYTTNHNGNSQSLDYILVNKNLARKNPKFEPVHINSDFMQRLSDHDPVIATFDFD